MNKFKETLEFGKTESKFLEIERKFVLDSLPEDIEKYDSEDIVQGYIFLDDNDAEVRIRKEGEKCFQTMKVGTGGTRFESEIEISQERFDSLWGNTQGYRIQKVRYKVPCDSGVIEIDVYKGALEGLAVAEIEFENKNDSEKFVAPEWFGKEVTCDQAYMNRNLIFEKRKEKGEKIAEYSLGEGIEKTIYEIESLMKENPHTIISIAGGSASGKTSAVAGALKKYFGDEALILSTDDYYRGITFMQEEEKKGNVLNWDQPEALDLKLLKKHLAQLREGKEILKPIYNIKTGESVGYETVKSNKLIINEGLFVLQDDLQEEADLKVFVDIQTHGRILRRLLRDISRTGQKPAEILRYFAEIVEPMHEKYIQITKQNADFIIKNEYTPTVEAARTGVKELQVKYRCDFDQEVLRKLGAERLGVVSQTDHYYNPRERDLTSTDEILRLREEGTRMTVGYKGPKFEASVRKRAKFEFEIDMETRDAFLKIYGNRCKTIKKERVLFQLKGITFSLDSVDGLGQFLELRSIDDGVDFKEVVDILGLDSEKCIKESYFEMTS